MTTQIFLKAPFLCSFRSSADSDDTTFNHLHTFSSYCPLKIDVTASNTLLDYRSQFFRIHCCCRIFDFNMSLCRGSMNQATINEAHSRVLYFLYTQFSIFFATFHHHPCFFRHSRVWKELREKCFYYKFSRDFIINLLMIFCVIFDFV